MASLLALFAAAAPIWHHSNITANFSYFLSPPFALPAPAASFTNLTLLFTAERSPQVAAAGTTQSKLFNAATLYLNGIPLTAGPGHATVDGTQPVRALDLAALGLLQDPPATNVLAIACSLFSRWGSAQDAAALPRLQVLLAGSQPGAPPAALLATSSAWAALDASAFHGAAGNVNGGRNPWYRMLQENLNATARPSGWSAPGYDRTGAAWSPAVLQPAFAAPLALEEAPLPAMLTRTACSATRLPTGALLLDYGQEALGGPNLTFVLAQGAPPSTFRVLIGEELTAAGGVMAPSRSTVNYTFLWTVPGGPPNASSTLAGLHAMEFLQYRYVELGVGAPALAEGGAGAWVVTAPRGGDGRNPYEHPCSASTPQTPGRAPPPPSAAAPASTAHAVFITSSAPLNAVWRLCAYTATATALDINVDSQTRQRDLCHVDAYITNAEQYATFPATDASVQSRTARAAFQASSAILPATVDFKASTVLMAQLALTERGDASVWRDVWASSDEAVWADGGAGYVSAQLLSGVRYFNASLGLLRIPVGCGASGQWGCDALIDWPTQTRDNYTVTEVDTLRNSFGAAALRALSSGALALGQAQAAARYSGMASAIATALGQRMLRWNGSSSSAEAYFADGLPGSAGGEHGAIHSTVYAVALGGVVEAWQGNVTELARGLTAYIVRRGGYGPASCMTAKVVVEALYTLGVFEAAAADFALQLLSRAEYPGWGAMLAVGATTTLEAWLPGDKWNTDWSHPWCASPAFTLLRSMMGVRPTSASGWGTWAVAPQPGSLAFANLTAPTPLGDATVAFSQGGGLVRVGLGVPAGSSVQVCLPPVHGGGGGGELSVDGAAVGAVARGRLLCTVENVGAGQHTVVRSAGVQ